MSLTGPKSRNGGRKPPCGVLILSYHQPVERKRENRFSAMRASSSSYSKIAVLNNAFHHVPRLTRNRHHGRHRIRPPVPSQRLGGAAVRDDVGVRGGQPPVLFAVPETDHGGRHPLRGGGHQARGARPGGVQFSAVICPR